MSVDLRHSATLSAVFATRRLRRLGPVPLLTTRAVLGATCSWAVVAVAVGLWAGFVARAAGLSAETVAAALIPLGLILGTGVGAVWGEVRPALVERSSWWTFAASGVSVRAYLAGRHLLGRLTRLGAATLGSAVLIAVVDGGAGRLSLVDWAGVMFAAVAAAACGVGTASVRIAPPPRSRMFLTTWASVTAAFVVCALVWVGLWASDLREAIVAGAGWGAIASPAPTATVALVVSSAAACSVACAAGRRVGSMTWADVMARHDRIGRDASQRGVGSYGGRRFAELALLDVRRALRSFEWRVRPGLFTVFAMLLSVATLSALAGGLVPHQVAELSGGPVGATIVGGICAGYALVVFSSLSPLVSLDSDRRAVHLMRTFPMGVRALAVARAMTGSVISAASGFVFIVVAAGLSPLDARATGTAAVACAAVAIVAPVGACAVSLRYPQTEWKEAAELGQRGWLRAVSTYAVGISIAVALSVASGSPWSDASAPTALVLLVIAPPLFAAGLTAVLPTTIGFAHGSRP